MGARAGVLALQGGFALHRAALERLGFETRLVRRPEDLSCLDALVFPGGESSTQLSLLHAAGLAAPLRAYVAEGRPLLGTCAGLILAAREVSHPEQESLGLLDVAVSRNGWGRQVHSFEARDDQGSMRCVFIRAPRITDVGRAEVLSTFRGEPILVRQGRVMGATFHPELTDERRVYEAWLS